jgi:uncharacterized OB-fold protein
MTTVHHAAGRRLPGPVHVALVELAGGGHAVCRLESGGDGDEVRLSTDHGAPVAAPV